ncbi:MAG: hypothetical protein ACJ742_11595 [Actinomycetes bacterium]
MAERLPLWPVLRQLRGQDRLGLGGVQGRLPVGPQPQVRRDAPAARLAERSGEQLER